MWDASTSVVGRNECANLEGLTRVLLLRSGIGSIKLFAYAGRKFFAFLPCPRNIVVEKLLNPTCEAVQGRPGESKYLLGTCHCNVH